MSCSGSVSPSAYVTAHHGSLPLVCDGRQLCPDCREAEAGRSGDPAWPLWGLAMRIAQAMGLHRDGETWGLPPEVTEERRWV